MFEYQVITNFDQWIRLFLNKKLQYDQADLHMHSRYSLDGEFGVEELIKQCKEAHLEVISIADHNQVKAVPEGLEYGRKKGITVIPGIEIDCQYKALICTYWGIT